MQAKPGTQSGRHHIHVKQAGVGGVHATHDRGDQAVKDAAAHPGTHQRGHARHLGRGSDGRGQEPVQRGPERAQEAECAPDLRVPRVGGDAQDTGLGEFARPVGQLHPCATRAGRDDFSGQAQLGGEVGHGGGTRGEGLGTAVEQEARHDVAAHAAAPAVCGLQDSDGAAGRCQFPGGQEAGDPAAHHQRRSQDCRGRDVGLLSGIRCIAHGPTPGKWSG